MTAKPASVNSPSGFRRGSLRAWAAGSLPVAIVAAALQLRRDFFHSPCGVAFNLRLFRTFRMELWSAALLSAGALGRRVLGDLSWPRAGASPATPRCRRWPKHADIAAYRPLLDDGRLARM